MKRLLSLLLIFALVFSLVPGTHAEEGEHTMLAQTQLEAIDFVRSMLVQRVEDFTVQLPMRLYYSNVLEQILLDAVDFTENPKEGDSLLWQVAPDGCYTDVAAGYAYLYYSIRYATTAQEEAELDAALDALLLELACDPSDKYETVKKVYGWVCANVAFDGSGLYADTAYGALIHRKASGYGMSLLMYQMLWKLGIRSRVVAGLYNGQEHAWLAVAADDYYYYVDAALDAGSAEYRWFLKGESGFADHAKDPTLNFPGYSFSDVNYEDREDLCQQMGHWWVGGSCVEVKVCLRCGLESQEYGPHYFLNNQDCESAKFCDTCKQLILPTGHTYSDDTDEVCDPCGHSRRIICLGESWGLDVSKDLDTDVTKVTAETGVTVSQKEEHGHYDHYQLTFAGEGRYQVWAQGGQREPEQYDVQVIDHTKTAEQGWCVCFEKLQENVHQHTWIEATCQAPRTCSECGETEGEVYSHAFYTPDCLGQPGVCTMCGLTQDSPPGHEYVFDSDSYCRRCYQQRISVCTEGVLEYWVSSEFADGLTLAHADPGVTVTAGDYKFEANYHYWQYFISAEEEGQYEVSFTDNATGKKSGVTVRVEKHRFVEGMCYLCLQKDPNVHFHSWVEATCTEPRTCSGCGLIDGYAQGHHLMNGPCTEPRTCYNCDLVMDAPSHYYSDDSDPDCNFCGQSRYVVCGSGQISVILSSGQGGDFSLKDPEEGIALKLMEFFVAEGVFYWEYIIETPGPGLYEVALEQKDGEEPLGVTLYVYDHEFVDGLCWRCGAAEGAHVHSWESATCEKPAVCTLCGETEGHALNHDFGGYDCSESAKCARCGAGRGKVDHSYDNWQDRYCNTCNRYRVAGCQEDTFVIIVSNEYVGGFRLKEAPSGISIEYRGWYSNWGYYEHTYEIKTPGNGTFELVLEDVETGDTFEVTIQRFKHDYRGGECVNCGKLDGSVHHHDWLDATCNAPKTCRSCGKTEGEPLGHSWCGPTCTDPKVCMECNAIEGSALGHDFVQWSCVEPGVCSRCNEIQEAAAGHSYDSDTDDHCNRCDQLRLFGCKGQPVEITFLCDTEAPFTLVNAANGVSMTLASCVAEGAQFLHTYHISLPGKGTYELVCAREGEPNRESVTVLVSDHSYKDGICAICGDEMVGLMGDVDGNGKLTYNDALMILRASIRLQTLDAAQMALADVDGNGKMDYNDALLVLRTSIGLA